MSGKLDQSLDEIMKDRPAGARRGRGRNQPRRNAATKAKAAIATNGATSGGIKKNTTNGRAKPATAAANTKQTTAAPLVGDSKIAVSNLPEDVTELMIKDFFTQAAGAVKRVLLNYGPSGRSRGSATVIFSKPDAAAKAASHDGTRVDNKPLRIEVLVGAKDIAPAAPAKSLSDRISKPKTAAQEKTKGAKTEGKGNAKDAAAAKTGRNAATKKSGRAGKPKPKTAEQLDAEMQDYFGGSAETTNGATAAAAAAAAAAAPAVNGADTNMDEVL